MNMFEKARTLRDMLDMCELTQGEIAKKMGVSQSYIANKLRLLSFPENIQKKILLARLSERHARVLLKIKDEKLIETAIEKMQDMKLSVAASEALVDTLLLEDRSKKLQFATSGERIRKFEELLEDILSLLKEGGIKVRKSICFSNSKRVITISIDEQENTIWNT